VRQAPPDATRPGVGQRLELFLYGTPHLAGSAAVLVGLGLYFGGVIDQFWWAILAGLYLAGYLIAGGLAGPLAVAAELDEQALQQDLQRLVAGARPRLPAAAQSLLDSIADRAQALIPALDELTGRGVIGAKVRHEVLAGLTRYLPDTLASYLALPPAYLKLHAGQARAPERLLAEQLGLIDGHLARCLQDAYAEHAAELAVQGRFLAERMGRGDLPEA